MGVRMNIQRRLEKLEQAPAGACERSHLRVIYGDDGSGNTIDEGKAPAERCECGRQLVLMRVVYGEQPAAA